MPIYIGNTKLTNLKIGSTTIDKVFVGVIQVYPDTSFLNNYDMFFLYNDGLSPATEVRVQEFGNSGSTLIFSINDYCQNIAVFKTGENSGKLWITKKTDPVQILEYEFTKNPLTYNYIRTITYSGLIPVGLTCPENASYLIGCVGTGVYSYNISGSIATTTKLFDMEGGRECGVYEIGDGDIIKNSVTGNYLVTTVVPSSGFYISEFTNTGTLVKEIQAKIIATNEGVYPYGIFQSGSKLYITSNALIFEIAPTGLIDVQESMNFDRLATAISTFLDYTTIGLP